MARHCAIRVAQAKLQESSSTSNAVAIAGKGAEQVCALAAIAGVCIADALIDTGSAFSMLSRGMYSRLRDAPAIQPFTRVAPDVVGDGGASAEIRGYVNVPVEVAGVSVHHPLLVVAGLAFPFLIGTDILRAHGAVLKLDESAPVRQRIRECAVCHEQSTEPRLLTRPTSTSLRARRATLSSSPARPHSFAFELPASCASS